MSTIPATDVEKAKPETSFSKCSFTAVSQDPKTWPKSRKWAVTLVMSATGLNRIMLSTIMAPALPAIGAQFHVSNTKTVMSMTIYILATAFGPLVFGPCSEVYGRAPVLHVTNVWFLVWNLACGFAHNNAFLTAARFLAGFGASAVYVLANAVLGDMWTAEERGKSLAIYSLIPLLGAAIGPVIGGFIAESTTWHWIFWSTSAFQCLMTIASLAIFRETHLPTIERKPAPKKERLVVKSDGQSTVPRVMPTLAKSLTKPMRLLLFHPLVQMQAVLSGFSYGVLYIVLSTFSELWVTKYHQSALVSGLHYFSTCLGEIVGAQTGGYLLDAMYRSIQRRNRGDFRPEHRILCMAPGSLVGAAGLFWYGWAAEYRAFWFAVDLGAFVQALGFQIAGQALQAYIIESYPDHVGSVSAASQLLRSLAAFGFPLFAPTMYNGLGYGWANSVLGFVTVGVAIGPPLFLWKHGANLRQNAHRIK